MKKLGLVVLLSVVAVGLSGRSAFAIPAFDKFFKATYVEASDSDSLKASYGDLKKCMACHYGKSKKNRNDYGKALSELLDRKKYSSKRVREEPDAVAKELKEAFEKVHKMKSKSGETFGDLLKAGKLPGTNPEE